MAHGAEGHHVIPANTSLQQFSAGYYVMEINLIEFIAQVAKKWYIPIIADKIKAEGADVKFVVTRE